jgi:Predicted periplasmic ligand-binding sensor domain
MLLSHDNKLYIGSYDGLGCLDLKTKNFVSTYHTNKLLSGYIIYTIFEDTKGYVWIGTSEGLFCIHPQNHQITSLDMKDGLPSNVICGICGDKQGNLWISTNYGISKYNPIKKYSLITMLTMDFKEMSSVRMHCSEIKMEKLFLEVSTELLLSILKK